MFRCRECGQNVAYWRHSNIRQPEEVRNGIVPAPHQPVAAMQVIPLPIDGNPDVNVTGEMPVGFSPLQRHIWQIIVDQIDEECQEMERNRRHCRGHEYLLSNLDKDLAALENIRNTFSITPVRDPQILDDNGIPVGLSPMKSRIWEFLIFFLVFYYYFIILLEILSFCIYVLH